jgi:hypothetical protein
MQTIKEQVDAGFRKRDAKEIKAVFEKYATTDHGSSEKHIRKENLLLALKEFDVTPEVSEADVCIVDFLFSSLDRNRDGVLTLNEFEQAVQAQLPLEQWADSLPLAQILTDAIPRLAGHDHLRDLGRLTKDDIIVEGFAYGMKRLLHDRVQMLAQSFAKMDELAVANAKLVGGREPSEKFRAEPSKLRCGNIDDFYLGMSSSIGTRQLFFV